MTVQEQVQAIIQKHGGDRTQLLAILRDIQEKWRYIPEEAITAVAEELDEPRVHVEGTATFYHFFSSSHRGQYTVYLNTSATSEMAGAGGVAQAFEQEAGISFGQTTADQRIGLYTTSCIGMSDQEPAALINDVVFTRLTPERVQSLVAGMKAGVPVRDLVGPLGDGNNSSPRIHAEVQNQIRLRGPVLLTDFEPGSALRKAMDFGSLEVIDRVTQAGLRGRGGAGFPTGQKWGFCRATDSDARYVLCNVDEGEPGTFKDRVLMTEYAHLVFEGMAVAGYAIEAKQGILYLRGEYAYLKPHLESVLENMRANHLLGRRILGTRFSFDVQIKVGAGAYICGEESSLIESAEGKRGQPRNRPPFPVTSGYLRKPTIVNNPETYSCAAKIMLHGPQWFKALGTPASSGVKLLSIAGDCGKPGVYEVQYGITISELLELCEAKEVMAVLVGGPSGKFISERQFNRKICFSDLPTGGAITIFGKNRDLLSIVHNEMKFFEAESCGFCVPCRAGNTLLVKALEKIMVGNGTLADIEGIQRLSKMVKTASRCGLGQTSPNPLLTTIEDFPEVYREKVRTDLKYQSQFDLQFAVADSCVAAKRQPNLEAE